jgi:hypothetical protein
MSQHLSDRGYAGRMAPAGRVTVPAGSGGRTIEYETRS